MNETLWKPDLTPKEKREIFDALVKRYETAWEIIEANEYGHHWLARYYRHQMVKLGRVHSEGHPTEAWQPKYQTLAEFETEVQRLESLIAEAILLRSITNGEYGARTPPWRIHPGYFDGFALLLARACGAMVTDAESVFGWSEKTERVRGLYECRVLSDYDGPDRGSTRAALNTGFGNGECRFPNADVEERFLTLLRLLEAYGAAKRQEGCEAGSNLLVALRDGKITATEFESERERSTGVVR